MLDEVARDVSAASAAVGALVTSQILTGTAQIWTVGILTGLAAAIQVLTRSLPRDPIPVKSVTTTEGS